MLASSSRKRRQIARPIPPAAPVTIATRPLRPLISQLRFVDRAHAVPDDNWELGITWERLEPALRWGVGACVQYARYEVWNEQLEAALHQEWNAINGPGTWEKVKRAIRRGFEAAHRKAS